MHLRKESMQPSGTSEQWVAWLTSPDEDLWKHATMALGGLQPGDNVAVEPLIHALRASKAGVVFWCVIGLGCLGKGAKEAVPELIRIATEYPQFGTRQAALYALSKVGPDLPGVKEAFLAALHDVDPFVRQSALQALISVEDLYASDLHRIWAMTRDRDTEAARWAEIALRNINLRRGNKDKDT